MPERISLDAEWASLIDRVGRVGQTIRVPFDEHRHAVRFRHRFYTLRNVLRIEGPLEVYEHARLISVTLDDNSVVFSHQDKTWATAALRRAELVEDR